MSQKNEDVTVEYLVGEITERLVKLEQDLILYQEKVRNVLVDSDRDR